MKSPKVRLNLSQIANYTPRILWISDRNNHNNHDRFYMVRKILTYHHQ